MSYAILCGNDQQLLQSRASVLRTVPIRAFITHGLSELESFVAEEAPELVVLCHSLSREEQRQAFVWVQSRYTSAKVIVLTSGLETQASSLGFNLNSSQGPQALVELSLKLLGRLPKADALYS